VIVLTVEHQRIRATLDPDNLGGAANDGG